MRCRYIQGLIVDPPKGRCSEEESAKMKRHLRECRRCAGFLKDHEEIQSFLRTSLPLVPPEELAVRTRTLCLARLKGGEREMELAADGARREDVPGSIYAVLVALFGLTLVFIASLLKDINPDQPLTLRAMMILAVMIQNAAMLFFAPLILRRPRAFMTKLKHKENHVWT